MSETKQVAGHMYEFPATLLNSLVADAEVFEVDPPGNKTLLADYAFAKRHGSVILVPLDDLPTASIPSNIAHDFDLGMCLWLLDFDVQNVLSAAVQEGVPLSLTRSMILMISNTIVDAEKGDIPRAAFPDFVLNRIITAGGGAPVGAVCHWVATMAAIRRQTAPLEVLAKAIVSAVTNLHELSLEDNAKEAWANMRDGWSREIIDTLKASANQ